MVEWMGTEIFTFRDGAHWIAAWRRFDVVSQGRTENEAVASLLRCITAQVMLEAAKPDGCEMRDVPRPTSDIISDWESRHRTHHPVPSAPAGS
jgi:hypothetical protein